jgi:signal transduction histidine kinase
VNRLQGNVRASRLALRQVVAGPDPAPAWHPRPQRERWAAAGALTAATLVLCLVNAAHVERVTPSGQDPAGAGQVTLAVVTVLPLLPAAKYPMASWRIGWLALLLSPLAPAAWWGGWPWGAPQALALLAAFCLAAVRQRRAALWWMWALTLIPWCVWLIRDIPNLHGPAGATLVFTAVTIAVDSVGSRLRTQRALLTQTVRTDTERSRRAVLEERTRIARELHDVVAHHLSLIAVQAETAPYRIPELPEPVRAEFGALSEVAREALTEMRRLLGVLRQDQPAGLAPQPQLADLPALVDSARRAGVEVALSVPVDLGTVPAGIGVCAYRIVQESLSNASRHAPGATVTVQVDQDAQDVQLRVANGPGGPVPHWGHERQHGHGLTGMRERVALLGGSLAAGPTPGGGFEVSVVLPLGRTS